MVAIAESLAARFGYVTGLDSGIFRENTECVDQAT